ncbi:MAG: catalase family protein, partial [Nitrosomonas sp.]|nr:catalase family protein [Nitrosomonas sp.]
SFDTFIRFSNGKSDRDNDADAHGMAIKLMDVEGEKLLDDEKGTQDFILADHPVFFARNIEHMNAFVIAFGQNTSIEEILKTHPVLESFKKLPKASPLESQYWSQTPYLLGECAARYSVIPAQANCSGKDPADSDNFLQEALIEFLTDREARFDFFVQLQVDPNSMDIEDPTLSWDECDSPPIKVATIIIPKQKFDSPSQMAFCEALSFNPWHSLPEHRPLGGINRARRVIYQDSSELRHAKYEPTGKEQF